MSEQTLFTALIGSEEVEVTYSMLDEKTKILFDDDPDFLSRGMSLSFHKGKFEAVVGLGDQT